MTQSTTLVDTPDVVELSTAVEVIADCADEAVRLDGHPHGTTRTDEAALNKKLLMLADRLALAEALVRNAYWQSREGESYEL